MTSSVSFITILWQNQFVTSSISPLFHNNFWTETRDFNYLDFCIFTCSGAGRSYGAKVLSNFLGLQSVQRDRLLLRKLEVTWATEFDSGSRFALWGHFCTYVQSPNSIFVGNLACEVRICVRFDFKGHWGRGLGSLENSNFTYSLPNRYLDFLGR